MANVLAEFRSDDVFLETNLEVSITLVPLTKSLWDFGTRFWNITENMPYTGYVHWGCMTFNVATITHLTVQSLYRFSVNWSLPVKKD